MLFNGKTLILTAITLVTAGPWGSFADSLRFELARREMPEVLLFLPSALSGLSFREDRAGIWSLSVLDAIRYRTDSADVRLDPEKSTAIALNRLEALFQEYGDWSRAIVAYSASPSALSAMEAEARLAGIDPDSAVVRSSVLTRLTEVVREYSDNPEASFERVGRLLQEREALRQHILRAEAAARQARADSFRKKQAVLQEKIMYTIRSGDTLGTIARRYRVRVSDIKRWNNLRSDFIREGRKLIIYRH